MDLNAMGNRIMSGIPQVPATVPHQVNGSLGTGGDVNQARETSFADFLSDAMKDTVSTDYTDKATNIGLMLGEVQDAHTVTIAAEKAEIALTLTMQMRNKMIEAYQEVSRMQI